MFCLKPILLCITEKKVQGTQREKLSCAVYMRLRLWQEFFPLLAKPGKKKPLFCFLFFFAEFAETITLNQPS